MGNPITGVRYLIRGLELVGKPGIRRFVAVPMVISAILFAVLFSLGLSYYQDFLDWLIPDTEGVAGFLRILLWPLFLAAFVFLFLYTFSLLANLIGTPFNGLLSQAVENHVRGQPPPELPTGTLLREMLRVLRDELRKVLYFALTAIPFLVLFLIPVVNLIAPFLFLTYTVWVMALEYLDYPMGNHRILFREQRRLLREQLLLSLGFGSAVLVLTMIPLVNLVAMPAAVAGATVLWMDKFEQSAANAERTPSSAVEA
jgi:CysZ protein